MVCQDDHSLLSVIPLVERQRFLKRLPAHDNRIDVGNELVVAILGAIAVAIAREPIEIAVRSCNKSVKADAHKDRALRHNLISFHASPLESYIISHLFFLAFSQCTCRYILWILIRDLRLNEFPEKDQRFLPAEI